MAAVNPIPEGFHSVTPHLVVRNAAAAIEFYKRAFGAKELMRMPSPDGKGVMHAELQIGNSRVMLGDEMPQMQGWVSPQRLGGTTVALHMYVPDTDAAIKRAVDAGARPTMPAMDAFWGDRYGKVNDPYGHEWTIATRMKNLTPEQIQAGAEAFFASFAGCKA